MFEVFPVMLFPIVTYRGSSPRGVVISNKACYDPYQVSQILTRFVPYPPTSPPPDEPTCTSTSYESILTTRTPTPMDITDFNQGVTIVVCDVEGMNTEVDDTADDASFM